MIGSDEEFALVLTRCDGGVHQAIGVIEDPALVERAIRQLGA
jgi:hypothetical protein